MYRAIFTALLAFAILNQAACNATGPKYRNVRSYSEGLVAVQASNGRWGYVNEAQRWVIQPRFEDTKEFQGGRAAVRQNGKWGFINKQGEWL